MTDTTKHKQPQHTNQPSTHSMCRNGDGNSSSSSRHDTSQAAGMFYYFIITLIFFRSPLQVKTAMAVVVAAAPATAEGTVGVAGGA